MTGGRRSRLDPTALLAAYRFGTPARWQSDPARQLDQAPALCAVGEIWAGPALCWPDPFRSSPSFFFLKTIYLFLLDLLT
jgi:hypothetical protein